jgi:hypothetical protein
MHQWAYLQKIYGDHWFMNKMLGKLLKKKLKDGYKNRVIAKVVVLLLHFIIKQLMHFIYLLVIG